MSKCVICGVELGLEPLAVDEDRQAHTACIEGQEEDGSDRTIRDEGEQ